MRVSLDWLQDYIDTSDISADELAEKLDLSGTEVENVIKQGVGLDNIVVAQIKKIKPHPNADKLVLCDTFDGKETSQIVCGAKNMKEGDKVALTKPGAKLPNGMEIKKAKIRGESSSGMLASEIELGFGEDASGVMIIDEKLKPGQALDDALDLNDTILELEITPNRPDLMSMIGMAREIGAILGRDFKVPSIKIKESDKAATEMAKVDIKDADLNPRYIAKMITGVKVDESPQWIKKRLLAAGARPINNLVDITNYVLFETGQPLHAFDYDLLEGGQIIVRRAKAKEQMTTLDDVERKLETDNLVIADKKKAIALAGVMGGALTEVNDKTQNVLLESAYFKPQNIGKTSRGLGLISESSIRFERGIDPNNTDYAVDRAAQLMQDVAGGTVLKGSVDVYPKPIKERKLKMRPARANSVLGIDLPAKKMEKTLSSLKLDVSLSNKELKVSVPTFRPDLEREIDLIEEIARLYDLNKIESTLPGAAQVGKMTELDDLQAQLRNILTGFGQKEAITYSFIDPEKLKILPKGHQKGVALKNPLSEEQSMLRTSLLPGLLDSLLCNVARKQVDVQLFEMGHIFLPAKGVPSEEKHLGIMLSGSFNSGAWHTQERPVDFFDAKGIVKAILKSLRIAEKLVLEPLDFEIFNPQRSFKMTIDETKLGVIGELHPTYIKENDLLSTAYVELNLDVLLRFGQKLAPFKGISAYPAVTLDVALLLDSSIKNQEVMRSIKEMGQELLRDVKLFDIYEGKGIEEGKKSMAYSLTYQSMERTLELDEVQKIHNSIIENLKKDLSAIIR